MKRNFLSVLLLFSALLLSAQESKYDFFETKKEKVKVDYHLTTAWRLYAGYVQDWQNSPSVSYPDMYLHGGKLGAAIDFNLPYNLALQTGLSYALTYGRHTQHWASASSEYVQVETIGHKVTKHTLNIPVLLFYRQELWEKLALVAYGGPQLQVGLFQYDNQSLNLSEPTLQHLHDIGVGTDSYNRYAGEQLPVNLQMSVGLGLEWDRYRLQGGYDFGLLNMVRRYPVNTAGGNSYMREWSWNVCFVYKF